MSSEPAFKPRLNLLTAYPYHKPAMTGLVAEMGDDCRWLLDSGAFTAWKSGKPIRLDDYCDFIAGLPVKPWRYFALDVIGDAVATRRNYDAMLNRGFRPVPVFTRGESLDELDRYFETSDVVALGGLAGTGQQPYGYVKAVMQHVAGRRVHILGFSAMNWLKFLHPYSCDSSSWEQASRYGQIPVYMGHGQFEQIGKASVFSAPPPPAIAARIRALGFDPFALAKRENWHGDDSVSRWISAASWIAASVDTERNLNTLLFLALAAQRIDLLSAGFRAVTGQTNGEVERQARLTRRQAA